MSTTYTTSIEAAARIESLIKDFVENSPENSMRNSSGDKAWETPLVGFSSGADPLYEEYKDLVGPFHYTPGEIFNLTFPEEPAAAEDLTVISWVLPHLRATKLDNRRERIYPSERWARARIMGEEFIVLLRKHVVAELGRAGIQAVSPPLSPHWSREESPKYGFASRWSERHAAQRVIWRAAARSTAMSARWAWIAPNRLIGLPNWVRCPAYTTVSFSAAWAVPTASAAVITRISASRSRR